MPSLAPTDAAILQLLENLIGSVTDYRVWSAVLQFSDVKSVLWSNLTSKFRHHGDDGKREFQKLVVDVVRRDFAHLKQRLEVSRKQQQQQLPSESSDPVEAIDRAIPRGLMPLSDQHLDPTVKYQDVVGVLRSFCHSDSRESKAANARWLAGNTEDVNAYMQYFCRGIKAQLEGISAVLQKPSSSSSPSSMSYLVELDLQSARRFFSTLGGNLARTALAKVLVAYRLRDCFV